VDLVPFKVCTYDCVYCQLGRTTDHTVTRQEHVAVEAILDELDQALATRQTPDYIGLAGSGEPTLHAGLGEIIAKIKERTTVPVAVLTNGSLLWQESVRAELDQADLVLPSLDAADEASFQRVNRPHPAIELDAMVQGLVELTRSFRGAVWLECLVLAGLTDDPSHVSALASLAERIGPDRVQLTTLCRPGADPGARAVPHPRLVALARRFRSSRVEVIHRSASNAAPADPPTSDGDEEILAMLSRRPCTVEDIAAGLGMAAPEVNKRLDALQARQAVAVTRGPDGVFFSAPAVTSTSAARGKP
jgi:wyosine [tRNA(Phe)-imidazoG37] synthetase (radical SAM superfamily)